MRLGVLLLAAGGSRRMGEAKLLLPWGEGTVVGASLRAALVGPAESVLVVTGHMAPEVEAACRAAESEVGTEVEAPRGCSRVRFVHNPAWADGMLTSIQAGVAALPAGLDGLFIALGDMPLIPAGVYEVLAERFADDPSRIVVPTYAGERGHPVLFPVSLLDISGPPADTGLRPLLKRHADRVLEVPVGEAGIRLDLDTPEEYARALNQRGS